YVRVIIQGALSDLRKEIDNINAVKKEAIANGAVAESLKTETVALFINSESVSRDLFSADFCRACDECDNVERALISTTPQKHLISFLNAIRSKLLIIRQRFDRFLDAKDPLRLYPIGKKRSNTPIFLHHKIDHSPEIILFRRELKRLQKDHKWKIECKKLFLLLNNFDKSQLCLT
ncbi:hypothetical protein PFISCL1PPCAC_11117, partial [Pristionchus fissidentatus]